MDQHFATWPMAALVAVGLAVADRLPPMAKLPQTARQFGLRD
jgi:hypothetical protein